MGLDMVELVMEIEEAFDISMPDDEAASMATVGDVFDYIVTKTNVPTQSSVCLSAIAFYSLRRAARTLGSTGRLRPRDSTLSMFPESQRRKYWAQLQERSKLTLPPLCRPSWLVATCTVLAIACSVYFGVLVYQSSDSQLAGFVSAIAVGSITGTIACLVTRVFAVYPTKNCRTVRGLAESVLRLNLKSLSERYSGSSRSDIWIALRSIIVEQLGVSPEEVTLSASFVKDLN